MFIDEEEKNFKLKKKVQGDKIDYQVTIFPGQSGLVRMEKEKKNCC